MSIKVHPTAIIHKSAKLADDVEVGPYAVIEANSSVGKGTKIGPHCVIGSFAAIGKNNKIFTGTVIGSISQDLKFRGDRSFVEIGDGNIIREYVTVNRSSAKDGKTKIGNNNYFMAYSHIAHDCLVGNGVIVANCGTFGGHVTIEDKVIMGGMVGVHQFVKIGKLAIIGGCSKVVQDIPPYCMADGNPAKVVGINAIGLKRARFRSQKINLIKKAMKILFFSKLSTTNALKQIKSQLPSSEETKHLIGFVENSKRGLPR